MIQCTKCEQRAKRLKERAAIYENDGKKIKAKAIRVFLKGLGHEIR